MIRRCLFMSFSLSLGFVLSWTTAALGNPVETFVLAADSVRNHAGDNGLRSWLGTQPDLAGAAVAQLIDAGVTAGDAGNREAEEDNLSLAAALAEADAAANPNSALGALISEYEGWNEAARADRASARSSEDAAWGNVVAQPAQSWTSFLAADSVYARIGDSASQARIWGRMGVAKWYLGDAAGVEAAYTEALRRRRAVQNRILEGATLNGLGSTCYLMKGDLGCAINWYEQAIALRRATGDQSGLGTSLTYAANVRAELGQRVEARRLYEQALPILQAVGSPTQVVENLFGTADLYAETGQPAAAIKVYEEALELCTSTSDCEHAALMYVELGAVRRAVGQSRECLDDLQAAESVLARAPDAATRPGSTRCAHSPTPIWASRIPHAMRWSVLLKLRGAPATKPCNAMA